MADILGTGNTSAPVVTPAPQVLANPPMDVSTMTQQPQEIPPNLAGSATPPPPAAGQPSIWKDLAMGALWGLAGAGRSGALSGHRSGADAFAMGAAGGAEGVLVDKPAAQAQQAQAAADIKFKTAQAADMQIDYAYKEKQLNNLSQEQQDAHAKASMEQLEMLKSMGMAPVAVTSDNPGDALATGRNLTKSQGGVPPLYTVDIGNQHVSFDLSQVAGSPQGLALLNRQRADMGQESLTPQQFAQMYPNQTSQVGAMHGAMDYAHPVIVDQKSLDDAKARLNTIQGQKNVTPEMKQDIDSLQKAIDIGEKSVKEGLDAANKKAAQAEQTRLDVQNKPENVQAQARLAGAKATAEEQAKIAADTASGEWKPKVTADEKKKAELAENIAENATATNGILTRRPDLVGAIAGRFTNAQQMIGNNDPDISAIGNRIHNIAMANSGVHGFRSQQGVEETEKNLLNSFKNGPQAVAGALGSNVDSVQTFIDNARPSSYQTHSGQGGAGAFYQKRMGAAQNAGPAIGEQRSINGQAAHWDGRGWLPGAK